MTTPAADTPASTSPEISTSDTENQKPAPTTQTILRGLVRRAVLLVVLAYVAYAVLLMLFQTSMIYHPRKYDTIDPDRLAPGTVQLNYATSQGKQVAFYVPPKATLKNSGATTSTLPETLWVCFHGNASLALHWMALAKETTNPQVAYLMIDYPGYGACEGRPTRASIAESSTKAYATLAAHLGTTPENLDSRLNVLGLSIGGATGLDFAASRPANPQRILLIAPFSTMKEMARQVVGRLLSVLLTERYDNVARLDEIARRSPSPVITFIHGQKDELVPFEMSQRMAAQHPNLSKLIAIPTATHGNILPIAQPETMQILNAPKP